MLDNINITVNLICLKIQLELLNFYFVNVEID